MKRSKFSLSHFVNLTGDMGYLIPLTWLEVIPGDTFQHQTNLLLRCLPILAPIMHPVNIRISHWYVPLRLIWEDFEDFITGGPDGTSTPAPPTISKGTILESSLEDYMGLPPDTYSPNLEVSAFPFRAYNLIFNHYFRDQQLVSEQAISLASGTDSTTDLDLLRVSWEKDYFTSARPDSDLGDTVTIPLLGDAPLVSDAGSGNDIGIYDSVASQIKKMDASATNLKISGTTNTSNAYVDLSQASGVSLNDLRIASAVQRFQERMNKYGSRYSEYLRGLGVKPSDGRLGEPEYLGGGRQTIQFSEVLAHDGSNTGQLKGHGIAAMRSNRYRRFFEEHGVVLSLLSVVPKAIYMQALPKKWNRTVKEDYYQRELVHLGDQEVLNKEVYANHTTPDDVFAYQSRYDEYRGHPSRVAGEFHSTLNHWHLARDIGTPPALNQSFIECNPAKRIFASTGTHGLAITSNHSIQARRLIPKVARARLF